MHSINKYGLATHRARGDQNVLLFNGWIQLKCRACKISSLTHVPVWQSGESVSTKWWQLRAPLQTCFIFSSEETTMQVSASLHHIQMVWTINIFNTSLQFVQKVMPLLVNEMPNGSFFISVLSSWMDPKMRKTKNVPWCCQNNVCPSEDKQMGKKNRLQGTLRFGLLSLFLSLHPLLFLFLSLYLTFEICLHVYRPCCAILIISLQAGCLHLLQSWREIRALSGGWPPN